MKSLTVAAMIAAAIFAGATSAQAQKDRALGAGSFLNPNGPAQGIWTEQIGAPSRK